MWGKSRIAAFFQWFVVPEGRKVGSLKRRVRSYVARGDMKNCTPLWREAYFQVNMYKTHHVSTTFQSSDVEKNCTLLWLEAQIQVKRYKTHQWRTTFWSWDVQKCHAAVARSTFATQNVKSMTCSVHFWTFRCGKMACGCGVKHICNSKYVQNTGILEHFWSTLVNESVRQLVSKSIIELVS